jgi:peptidoglycan/LPS O-acetylase OafA/YrhL
VATPACLDNLGLGALLAVCARRYPAPPAGRVLQRVVLPLSIAVLVILRIVSRLEWSLVVHDTVQAIGFCCVIHGAAVGYRGLIGRGLEWKPLLYLGKISYGLYVYHPLMPPLIIFPALRLMGANVPDGVVFGIATLASLAAASLSWHLMEKPLNDLKRYF